MSRTFWLFVIATTVGLAPGIIWDYLTPRDDASIGAGLVVIAFPPICNCVAGWTCPPGNALENVRVTTCVWLGSSSITLPCFLITNLVSAAPVGVAVFVAIVQTAIIVGLSLLGARIGLAIRAGRSSSGHQDRGVW